MLTAKNTVIRAAVSEDLPRIIEIARQSFGAAQWNTDEYELMLSPGISLPAHVVLIAEQEGPGHAIHGFLAAKEAAGEWEIENLAVRETARRRGLGLRLLHEFLQLVHRRQGTAIYLEVRESNEAARALYSKCTFVEAGRRKSYYRDPEEDALILKFSFSRET